MTFSNVIDETISVRKTVINCLRGQASCNVYVYLRGKTQDDVN